MPLVRHLLPTDRRSWGISCRCRTVSCHLCGVSWCVPVCAGHLLTSIHRKGTLVAAMRAGQRKVVPSLAVSSHTSLISSPPYPFTRVPGRFPVWEQGTARGIEVGTGNWVNSLVRRWQPGGTWVPVIAAGADVRHLGTLMGNTSAPGDATPADVSVRSPPDTLDTPVSHFREKRTI